MRYLFHQPKFYATQAKWLALINEFYFNIKHIQGKENKVVDALNKILQVAHLESMSTFEFNIKEKIKETLVHGKHFQHVKVCL